MSFSSRQNRHAFHETRQLNRIIPYHFHGVPCSCSCGLSTIPLSPIHPVNWRHQPPSTIYIPFFLPKLQLPRRRSSLHTILPQYITQQQIFLPLGDSDQGMQAGIHKRKGVQTGGKNWILYPIHSTLTRNFTTFPHFASFNVFISFISTYQAIGRALQDFPCTGHTHEGYPSRARMFLVSWVGFGYFHSVGIYMAEIIIFHLVDGISPVYFTWSHCCNFWVKAGRYVRMCKSQSLSSSCTGKLI